MLMKARINFLPGVLNKKTRKDIFSREVLRSNKLNVTDLIAYLAWELKLCAKVLICRFVRQYQLILL